MVIEEFWSWAGDEPEMIIEVGLDWPRGVFSTERCVQFQVQAGFTKTTCIALSIPAFSNIFSYLAWSAVANNTSLVGGIESRRTELQDILDYLFYTFYTCGN